MFLKAFFGGKETTSPSFDREWFYVIASAAKQSKKQDWIASSASPVIGRAFARSVGSSQ
jgi:hypothetical protein